MLGFEEQKIEVKIMLRTSSRQVQTRTDVIYHIKEVEFYTGRNGKLLKGFILLKIFIFKVCSKSNEDSKRYTKMPISDITVLIEERLILNKHIISKNY